MGNDPIRVGIIGFGRSGCDIHANALKDMGERYRVVAICDPLPERRAHPDIPDARAYERMEDLLADENVELAVVAPPNHLHFPGVLAALKAGKHVVSEKPFGYTTADVDAMIEAAGRAGRVLQPFQQRRYEADFVKVRELCQSGIFGRLTFIRISWSGFGRRWDWQTTRAFGGGQLYNNMPHPIDHALEIFGDADPEVWCEMRRSLASGDAEDEVQVLLRAPGAPTIQIDLLATSPYPRDRWYVCGTAGGLRGDAQKLQWKSVDWSTMPERPVDTHPTEGRTYNRETIEWREGSWTASSGADSGAGAAPASHPTRSLYTDLFATIREGAPQVITPQAIRRRVAIMEKCYRQCRVPFPETSIDKES